MSKFTLRGKDLLKIGYSQSRAIGIAVNIMQKHYGTHTKAEKLQLLSDILSEPSAYLEHDLLGGIAKELFPPIASTLP